MGQVKVQRIRELNDAFRKSPWPGAKALGRLLVTAGVDAHGPEFVLKVLNAVAGFDKFSGDNDPYGEHDFGAFDQDGQTYFFKIDYFDPSLSYHSEDASNPKKTARVLTIMRADEY